MKIQSQSTQSTQNIETPMDEYIVIQSHPTTPVTKEEIMSPISTSPVGTQYVRSTTRSITRSPTRSRHSTPIVEPINISPISAQRTRHVETEFSAFTSTGKQRMSSTDDRAPPLSHNIEAILVKQSKQIRALYELQKATFEKLSTFQNQMRKLTSKMTELSQKVFSVSNHNLIYIVYH